MIVGLATLNGVDHYRTLGVAPAATRDEIRRAYLALARRHHPDRLDEGDTTGGAAEGSARMAAVNEAWRILGDEDERAAYDRGRHSERRVQARPAPAGPPRWVDAPPVDMDEPAPDTISGTPVQLALRVLPWVVIVLVILGLFVFTAYAGPDDDSDEQPVGLGSCVRSDGEQLIVVACDRVNDGRIVEILPLGRECSDPDTRRLRRPGPPGTLCLETTLNTRSP